MIRRADFKKTKGQSTLELALLTPIVFFLIYLIILGFRLNSRSSAETLEQHQVKLDKLDHGNGSFVLDGIDIPPGQTLDLLPDLPPIDLSKLAGKEAGKLLAHLGLNLAISKLKIFDGKTYISGGLRGGVQAGASSFIDSGFKTIDWESAAWGAGAGAFQSEEATRDFQGANPLKPGLKESLGSAAQSGIVSIAQNQGKTDNLLQDSFSGLIGSETFNPLEAVKGELLLGAARGALQSTFTGAIEGKLDAKTVLVATGMGAFQTQTVAQKIPLANWSGGDARQSASFQAVNAALSTAIGGGSSKESLYAAVSGAFFSSQSMNTLAGDSALKASIAGGAFGATMAVIEGQPIKAAGLSALEGVATGIATRELAQAQQEFIKSISKKSPGEIRRQYKESKTYGDEIADQWSKKLDADFRRAAKDGFVQSQVLLHEGDET